MKKRILEYSITTGAFSILAFVIAVLFGLFQYQEAFRKLAALCDGFFISGFFCLAVGVLLFVHNNGFFDIIVYGMFRFVTLFMKKKKHNYETFYDYSVMRAEKPKVEFGYFLIIGAIFILVSLVFLYFWAKESGTIQN